MLREAIFMVTLLDADVRGRDSEMYPEVLS
jgi:hypothetical protein